MRGTLSLAFGLFCLWNGSCPVQARKHKHKHKKTKKESVRASGITRPECRKSPEVHGLWWPDGRQELFSYGGKGEEWIAHYTTHKKKHGKHRTKLKKLGPHPAILGDTWAFNVSQEKWIKIDALDHPSARWKPASTTIDDHTAIVMFGGCKSTKVQGVMNDLWLLTPMQNSDDRDEFAKWTEVTTVNPPAPRRGHVMVANATHLIVVGGKTHSKHHALSWAEHQGTQILTDLWSLPLDHVRQFIPMNAALAKPIQGVEGASSAGQWVQGANFAGSPRWGATGTLLHRADGTIRLALFGGRYLNDPKAFHTTLRGAYTYYNDLWLYDPVADSWSLGHPGGATGAPPARDHHGATTIHGDLFIFGGRMAEERTRSALLNDVWSWSLATGQWTQHVAAAAARPLPRFMPGVSTVKRGDVSVLAVLGGQTFPGSTENASMNDLWVFHVGGRDGQGGYWTQLRESNCGAEEPAFLQAYTLVEEFPEDELEGPGPAIVAGVVGFGLVFGLGVWRMPRRPAELPMVAEDDETGSFAESPADFLRLEDS